MLLHCATFACCLARESAGNSIAARMAIMAITTNNSISVNAPISLDPDVSARIGVEDIGVERPIKGLDPGVAAMD